MTEQFKDATPRPWRIDSKTRIWYAGDEIGFGSVEIAKFGEILDSDIFRYCPKRSAADCALAVVAVNAYDPDREAKVSALIDAAEEALGQLTGGMDGKWSPAFEVVPALRNAIAELEKPE